MIALFSFSQGFFLYKALKRHTTDLNPLPHLQQYFIRKIAKKNDLSPRLIMRLHGAFISIVSVCSPTVCQSFMFGDVFIPTTILLGLHNNVQRRKHIIY